MTGAALGALLIGVINTLIVLLGLPSQYEYFFVAIVLVIAGLQARGGDLVKEGPGLSHAGGRAVSSCRQATG